VALKLLTNGNALSCSLLTRLDLLYN
jgi:hypothetical protein